VGEISIEYNVSIKREVSMLFNCSPKPGEGSSMFVWLEVATFSSFTFSYSATIYMAHAPLCVPALEEVHAVLHLISQHPGDPDTRKILLSDGRKVSLCLARGANVRLM
jgi:hypothetical protein